MRFKLLITEWDRVEQHFKFKPFRIKRNKRGYRVPAYIIPLTDKKYPRFHFFVYKSGIWRIIDVHIDIKPHKEFHTFDPKLFKFMEIINKRV